MKKSKLKEIIKETVKEALNDYHAPKIGVAADNNLKFSDISEDDKIKMKKMILGLTSKTSQGMDIHISSDRIDFNGEMPNSKSYFNITITKGIGITLSTDSNRRGIRSYLGYEKAYDDLIDDILKIKSDVDSDNFNQIYSDIMSGFKILRESNLDDILNQSKADFNEL